MPYASVIQDKVKYSITKSKLNIVKSRITKFYKTITGVCTLYANNRVAFSVVGQMHGFSLRPFFAKEIIPGSVAFVYIENIQTFTSVPFGWDNSAPDVLWRMITTGLALGPLSRLSADKAAR